MALRQQYRLKTPDAIIAATALTHSLQLLTVDSSFTRIVNLVVLNPLIV
ncbi:PIN domain-containing protein [Hymenobacter sp.]